jgi:hypothetical protein
MLKLLRAIGFLFLALALCSAESASGGGDAAPSEPQMKAAFLLNFPKYVEWPTDSLPAPGSPIVFAIFGDADVANEFAAMINGRSIDGHPIELVRNPSPKECLECQILFIGSDAARKTAEIVKQLKCASVLTVGESEQFMNEGGMINLARRERRIVLEVNLEATRQTELKISSKLMALATVKGGRK